MDSEPPSADAGVKKSKRGWMPIGSLSRKDAAKNYSQVAAVWLGRSKRGGYLILKPSDHVDWPAEEPMFLWINNKNWQLAAIKRGTLAII
jgi:hypothetical protein